MSRVLEAFLFLGLILLSFESAIESATAQANKDRVEILADNAGYKCEAHEVETEDGYILTIHRILKKSNLPLKGSAFFQHGLMETSASFIRSGSGKSLPFILSDLGYEVWLGNTRGNDYGLRHKTLATDSKEFWDFSFHEFGVYDMPAMFDLMLKVSNTSRGFYFAHSQGGAIGAIMLSMRPEYNKKIVQAHLMSPAIFMKNAPHPLFEAFSQIIELFALKGSYDFRNSLGDPVNMISEIFCPRLFDGELDLTGICRFVVALVCGFNKGEEQIDTRILTSSMQYLTHSVSLKQFLHFFQLHRSGNFTKFDYGPNNMRFYRSPTAPNYPIENIVAPVFLYAGSCDALVSEIDIKELSEVLPNVKKFKVFHNYNHCDFVIGKNSKRLLFDGIVRSMQQLT